ncbi:MAG: hypothetical protein HY221_00775, partial [Candidatus Sungbacteria bacterium]|nr:hypothetical protein [Candidatus Sungbacteria bacterium]
MTRHTRRIFFYVLAGLFIIIAPLLVSYSFGYTFDFSRAQFFPTGGIFLKSGTARVSIFLDGTFIKETGLFTGSTILSDISPRTHLVRLEKQGFRAWSKTINVKPYVVTELRFIALVPDPVPIATSTPRALASLAPVRPAPAAAISQDRAGNLYEASGRAGKKKIIAGEVHSWTLAGDHVLFI